MTYMRRIAVRNVMTSQPLDNRPRVLLVEDYPLARSATARALRPVYDVTAVGSGEQALAWLRDGSFDVLLSDFHMPAMTGVELFEIVRLREPGLRRVLMSALPVPGMLAYLAAGIVHAFLYKPFDLAAARSALDVRSG